MKALKIVLVDAAETSRRLYTLALRSQDYEVVAEASASKTLLLLKQHAPVLLILDMMLPGGNPFELCGRLRQQFPQLPIILLSERPNGIQPVEQRWAVGRGATDLIAKNLDDPEPLLLRVNQLARNLSAVNHEALTSARTALQQPKPNLPIAAPQLIQRPKNGLLQSLINALQSAAAPPDEAAPKSVRYRGTNVPNKE